MPRLTREELKNIEKDGFLSKGDSDIYDVLVEIRNELRAIRKLQTFTPR